MSGLKKCFKCGGIKKLDDFYRHSAMADGLLGKCKECTKSDVRKHRSKNIEKIREYDRQRAKLPKRKKAMAVIGKRWRKQDKRRNKCHNAVSRAIKAGQMVVMNCERCGSTKAVAHHDSYDRPLSVKWLCAVHHSERHKELAAKWKAA